MIFKGHKLTIGLDLAIAGRATAFWMKQENHSGTESGDNTGKR